ncbi:PREDICTED: L-type lectin-domain containing receptor kinase VIII.1-like [Tarenaya hassleriana]|uniref:L-type lectin-domain containing receptor kinase VIII.1-like n=1 Tax=Tarenaya hassleriana TaxID=28532 RepID=UPI00053C2CFF|nr:PREDICTED: L-type lectin-domain containing receptor kinase VIII.1-like [Tarenaya hassleriana]
MADLSLSRYFAITAISFIAFFSGISLSDESPLFSFQSFGKDVSFESDIAMYGDAKVVDGDSSIQLTNSVSYSSGRVVYKNPIKLVENDPEHPFPASFSTFFSLSMSPGHGSCLGFAVFPALSGNNGTIRSSLFEVEFDTSANVSKYGDSNENHVAVLVDGSVMEKISNFTSADLVMNSEEKLYAWIDYQSDSKRLEVRFRNSGDAKPIETLISYWIDFSAMVKDNEFMVGVYSYNQNSTQTYNLHSWSLEVRRFPRWVHSYALVDPKSNKPTSDKKRKDMALQILTCFITTFGSMAFLSFALVYLCRFFRRDNLAMVVPEECGLKAKDFEYKKMEKAGGVAVSKAESQEPKRVV